MDPGMKMEKTGLLFDSTQFYPQTIEICFDFFSSLGIERNPLVIAHQEDILTTQQHGQMTGQLGDQNSGPQTMQRFGGLTNDFFAIVITVAMKTRDDHVEAMVGAGQ